MENVSLIITQRCYDVQNKSTVSVHFKAGLCSKILSAYNVICNFVLAVQRFMACNVAVTTINQMIFYSTFSYECPAPDKSGGQTERTNRLVLPSLVSNTQQHFTQHATEE